MCHFAAPWALMVGRSFPASHHFWMILENLMPCLYSWLLMKVMKVRTTSTRNSCCSTNKRLAWESRRNPLHTALSSGSTSMRRNHQMGFSMVTGWYNAFENWLNETDTHFTQYSLKNWNGTHKCINHAFYGKLFWHLFLWTIDLLLFFLLQWLINNPIVTGIFKKITCNISIILELTIMVTN